MPSSNIEIYEITSNCLKDNYLNDPYIREIIVYVPYDYLNNLTNDRNDIAVAAIYLPGYGSNARSFLNIDPFSENIQQRMDRLIKENKCGPMIIAVPDCFTKFGGNQYLNSIATGRYEDFIIFEVLPFLKEKYNIINFAIFGKSSGAYGALTLGMKHPETFNAIACHSPDSAFEYCYLPDFPKAIENLRTSSNGIIKNWLEEYWRKENKKNQNDFVTLNILGMAAHYSPNKSIEHGFDLPFNVETGEIEYKIWNRWLESDPIRMIDKYYDNLKKIKMIYLDCGKNDEYNLQLGCRMLHSKLTKRDINHEYLEFDGGHSNTNFRYDISLSKLYNSLKS